VDVSLFALGHALALLNMLVAMTFNPGFLAALVVGACACVRLRGGVSGVCVCTQPHATAPTRSLRSLLLLLQARRWALSYLRACPLEQSFLRAIAHT